MGLDVATATSMLGDLIRRILRLPPPLHGAASAPCRTAALRRAEGDTHEDPDGSDARCRTSRPPPRDRPHDAGTRGRCRAHDGIVARTEGGPCRPPLPAAPAWCGPRSAPHHGVCSRYGHPSARPRARDLFLLQVLPRSHPRATRHVADTDRGRASRRDHRRSNLLRVHAPFRVRRCAAAPRHGRRELPAPGAPGRRSAVQRQASCRRRAHSPAVCRGVERT